MRLRALLVGSLAIALAVPAAAQVKVREHGDKKNDVEVREHPAKDKDKNKDKGGVVVREHDKKGITVSGYAPTSGPVGTRVTINGSGFLKTTKVVVGGKPVKSLNTDTTLTFDIPKKFGDGSILVRHPGHANDVVVGTFQVVADPELVSFAPPSGAAGTRVEILGSGFMQGDQVLFNGKVLGASEFAPNRIVVTIPQTAQTDFFTVARPNGAQSKSKKQFKVVQPAPTITSFSPTSGPPGTQVRITGSNFDPTARVAYGRFPLQVTARTETTLDVVVPTNATTSETFAVKGASGGAMATQPFVLVLNPEISRFQPLWGAPGSKVEIFGSHFRPGDSVLLGNAPIQVTNLDEAKVTVVIPQGARSDLFHIRRGGATVASATKPFEVVLAPTISGFSPTGGPAGTQVTITGTNFGPETRVVYGAQNLPVKSNNGTQIVVEVPRNATNQTFAVRNRGGEAISAQSFQVYTYSTISSVAPLSGAAGTRVMIRVQNFNSTDVFFLGNVSLPIVERTPEGYVVTIPAQAQSGNIEWESYGKRTVSRFKFTVLQPPAISSFSPTAGPVGTQVTITGANFSNKTAVFFESLPCQVIKRTLPTQLTVVIPQNASGTGFLWVDDAGSRQRSSQTYQVVPPPVISSISPNQGQVGAQVTIMGANFTNAATVWYGDVGRLQMPIVKRTLPNKLIVTVAAGGAAADFIWVEDGGQRVRSQEQFRIVTLPSATSVNPLSGPVGTRVTLTGANFTGNTKVWLGTLACPIEKRSPNEIVFSIPAGAKGRQTITLEDNGQKVATTVAFEVVDPPPPTEPADKHHDHAHEHPHKADDHHHHPHAHPHKNGATHHHPY